MESFFRHENQPFPPALSQFGKIRYCNKGDLLNKLSDQASVITTTEKHVTVFDGSFVAQYLKPRYCITFGEYGSKVFIPHISKALSESARVDIVWDDAEPFAVGATGEKTKTDSGADLGGSGST